MNLAIQADSRPILTVSPDDFARCPDCSQRLEIDGQEMARDEDGPIYLGTCPTHGGWRWQVERVRAACPECGSEATIYARLDVQWDETEQRWELLAHASDSPLDCSECDHEFFIGESEFPELPDYIAKPETLPGLAKALGQADGDVVLTIADGLDACCDGRGWDATHQAAADLANQAPALRDALRALMPLALEALTNRAESDDDEDRALLPDWQRDYDNAAALLAKLDRVQDLGGRSMTAAKPYRPAPGAMVLCPTDMGESGYTGRVLSVGDKVHGYDVAFYGKTKMAKFVKIDAFEGKFCVMIAFDDDMDCLVFGSAKRAKEEGERMARIHSCELRNAL